jgi:hypothetical protein
MRKILKRKKDNLKITIKFQSEIDKQVPQQSLLDIVAFELGVP